MIDFDQLTRSILQGAVKGLARGTKIVEKRAVSRAPVRNIFGRGYAFRVKTASEMGSDLSSADPSRAASYAAGGGIGGGDIGPMETTVDWESYQTAQAGGMLTTPKGKKRQPRDYKLRRASSVARLLADYDDDPASSPLTRQGAHEVRSKRAEATVDEHISTGGRLRGEIYSVPPRLMGDVAEAWVISPTPYARFQEFGTRHNRAHPFLRPALMESREEVVTQVAEAVRKASKGKLANVDLEIRVRL